MLFKMKLLLRVSHLTGDIAEIKKIRVRNLSAIFIFIKYKKIIYIFKNFIRI